MARFDVIPKSGSGSAKYSGTPTFTGTYMKPGMLEFREAASPSPIGWEVGDYVVYTRTGLTYRLYTVPQLKKQARSNTYGGAYIYQGVQFFDDSKQLEICPFRDLVAGDNRIHFSARPSISTFEGVDGIARRLQACLDDMYPNEWYVRLATTAMGASQDLVDLMAEAREFTVSGVSLLGALDKVYEVWPDVGWVFTRERVTIGGSLVWRNVITIGGGGLSATPSYLYGKGNGLLSITRTVANADEFANRIFAYGSSRNMLPRWYNSQNIKDAESVDIQNLMLPIDAVGTPGATDYYPGWGKTLDGGTMKPDAAKAFVEDSVSQARLCLRPKTCYFDGTGDLPDIYPSIRETTIGMVREAIGDSTAQYYPSPTIYTDASQRIDRLLSAQASFDSGLAGDEGKSASVSSSETLGELTGSGTIQSGLNASVILSTKNYTITSTRETDIAVSVSGGGAISFSATGGYANLAISIQKGDGTNFTEIRRRSFDLPFNADGDAVMKDAYVRVDNAELSSGDIIRVYVSLFLTNTRGDASLSYSYSVSPNVSFSAMWSRKKTFFVNIRQVGFDITEQALLGEGKTIAMRSGKCAGRSFSIKSCSYDSTNDAWVLECWRSEDESLSQWFPNADYPVRGLENAGQSNEYPGDEFVLLDIAMPDIYVRMAELKLLRAAQELLADTATERWQYIPEIDAKFMVENSRTIVAGQNMTLQDADIIGSSAIAVLVDSLTINEGEAAIPTYKVTLRDRKRKTWTESGSATEISSKPVSNATQESIQSVGNSVSDSFFELDADGNVTLKEPYANLYVKGWLSAGGIGQGGSGGGGLITSVKSVSDLGTPIPIESLTETFSAKAIESIYEAVQTKQPLLVSGTNIKTINSQSLLGSGDIVIQDGEDGESAYEIWLDEGNVGTKADFLASLQGNSGYTGAAGELQVVNNVVDGGATDALSAEQGKLLNNNLGSVRGRLDDFLDAAGEYIAVSGWQNGIYGGNGVFYPGESPLYSGTTVDVSNYQGKKLLIRINSYSALYCGFKTASGTLISTFQTDAEMTAYVTVPDNAVTLFLSNYNADLPNSSVYVYFYDSYEAMLPIKQDDIYGFFDGTPLALTITDGGFYSQSGLVITYNLSEGNSAVVCAVAYGNEYIVETPVNVPSSMYQNFFIFAEDSTTAVIDSGEIVDYVTPLGQKENGLYQYLVKIPNTDCAYLFSAVGTSRKDEMRVFVAVKKALHWLDLSDLEVQIEDLVEEIAGGRRRIILADSILKPIDFADKRLVAFGDSITAGVTSPNYGSTQDSYIKLFCDYAGVGTLDNRAVSGSTVVPVGANDIYNRILALTGAWDIIWIAGGTNDWNTGKTLGNWGSTGTDTFYGALKGICSFLAANYPDAVVIFVTPIPYTKDASNWPNHNGELDDYRSAIYEVATYYGYNVVNGADLGMPKITGGWNNTMIADSDGCHPTELGHALYARNLTDKLL